MVVYLYTVVAFNFFRKFYNKSEDGDTLNMKCDDMLTVSLTHTHLHAHTLTHSLTHTRPHTPTLTHLHTHTPQSNLGPRLVQDKIGRAHV